MERILLPSINVNNLKVEKAIIQGGMGVGISLSGLASAVANEGGIGVISSVALGVLEEDPNVRFKDRTQRILKREIRKARVPHQWCSGAKYYARYIGL